MTRQRKTKQGVEAGIGCSDALSEDEKAEFGMLRQLKKRERKRAAGVKKYQKGGSGCHKVDERGNGMSVRSKRWPIPATCTMTETQNKRYAALALKWFEMTGIHPAGIHP